MAKFSFNGMDDVCASFDEMTRLSDEERLGVIRPAAEVLRTKFREKIRQWFKQHTGSLADSFHFTELVASDATIITVSPKGKHKGTKAGRRIRRGRDHELIPSRVRNKTTGLITNKTKGTNAEIAYILEYGSPRIKATHWMQTTVEESEDEVAASVQKEWNDLLEKKGL